MGPLVAGEENLVAGGAGLADGGHGGLDGGGPLVDVDIVLEKESVQRSRNETLKLEALIGNTYRLVHKAERNLSVALVLGGNLRPDAGELSVSRSALANNSAVPAAVVVEVDDAERSAGCQAALNLLIEDSPVGGAEGAADSVVDEVLPADRDTESVETVVLDEVVHLVEAVLAGVDIAASGASAVGATAEIETGNLYDVLEFSQTRTLIYHVR